MKLDQCDGVEGWESAELEFRGYSPDSDLQTGGKSPTADLVDARPRAGQAPITAPVFWFIGRSAAGKTTLASRSVDELRSRGVAVVQLDGDQWRAGLSRDLGFSAEARTENHRRLAEVAKLISDQGILVMVASMGPLELHRSLAEKILGERVRWVFVDASLETCIRRDPKRLYQQALAGRVTQLLEFPFEPPVGRPAMLHLVTDFEPIQVTMGRLRNWVNVQLPSSFPDLPEASVEQNPRDPSCFRSPAESGN